MKNKTLIEQSELVKTLLEAHPEHGGQASPAAMRTSFEDNPHMKPTKKQKEFMKTRWQKIKGGAKKVVGKVKKAVGLGDWTMYEGTPLAEKCEFIKTFLEGSLSEKLAVRKVGTGRKKIVRPSSTPIDQDPPPSKLTTGKKPGYSIRVPRPS